MANSKTDELCSVVGIGASAGGLQALEELFKHMHNPSGCAFIIVQHLSPDFKSLMDDLIARQTDIAVLNAEDGMPIEPNCIYIPPPGTQVLLNEGKFDLKRINHESRSLARIDQFFKSLSLAYEAKAIAIVLSGSGSDGSRGAMDVHQRGGCVICQDMETAQFDSMPRSTMRTECVDAILSPNQIAEFIKQYLQSPKEFKNGEARDTENSKMELFHALQNHLGIDFSQYKDATVTRRILRRFVVCGANDLQGYLNYIQSDEEEIDALYHDLLIGVTEFFRDAEVYDALKVQFKKYLVTRPPGQDIRVWVAGCATGQEAYSLAILIDEIRVELDLDSCITIYATDAHQGSLARASEGIYSKQELAGISEERLKNCFEQQSNEHYRVMDRYRRMVLFAHHNLLSDPPFTRMDLVSCRNVLIYFQPSAQNHLIGSINYALKDQGVLLLGNSEGLSHLNDYFDVENKKAKIFTKSRQVEELPIFRGPNPHLRSPHPNTSSTFKAVSHNVHRIDSELLQAYDILLGRHMPPGILISSSGKIIHYFGDVQKYLDPLQGRPSSSVLDCVSGQVKIAIATLIQRINAGEQRVEYRGIAIPDESNASINLIAESIELKQDEHNKIHLTFESSPSSVISNQEEKLSSETYRPEAESIRRIQELEAELSINKENLQATIEELQTTNEELQASNEEMLASNEELQSTNEELQSVNEELYTVNSEYLSKNEQLLALNAEHQTILESVDIGIVFIDSEHRIRKFNRAILDIMQLLPQDVGRPIDHLATRLLDTQKLMECTREVFNSGNASQQEVVTQSGTHFLMRIFPFTHPGDQSKGAILTFSSLTEVREASAKLRLSEERLSLAVENANQGLWETNPQTEEAYYSPSWHQLLGYKDGKFKPSLAEWKALVHPEDEQAWWSYFDKQIEQDHLFSGEFRMEDIDGTWHWMLCRGRVCERNPSGQATRVIGLVVDVSDFKRLELNLRETERRLELSLRSADQVWWEWDIPAGVLAAHGTEPCILGYECLDIDKSEDFWWNRVPGEEVDMIKESLDRHFKLKDDNWRCEHRYRDRHGDYRWVIEWGRVIEWAADGSPVRMIGITQLNDVNKTAQIALEESRLLYRSIIEDQDSLICRFGPDYTINYVNRAFAEFFASDCNQIVDTPVIDLFDEEDRVHFQLSIATLKEKAPISTTVKTYPLNEGRFKWIEWTDRAFFDSSGKVIGYQTIGRDITQLKESEEQLRRLLAEAEEARKTAEDANKAKSEFLAVINHELRTPLNPIIAGSELLAEIVQSSEEQHTMATMIHSAGEHLLSLINSVLDLSKLEAEKVTPVLSLISPSEIIDKVTQFFIPLAQQKGLEFKMEIAEDLPETIVSDSFIIRQILINIIGNAFKFTPEGSIQLTAFFEKDNKGAQSGIFKVSVKDTGIGVTEDMQEKIFDPFSQADTGVSREFGGTGIGLAISKQSANLLGGDIELRSKLGEGSEFILSVPAQIKHSEETIKKSSEKNFGFENLEGSKVLVVDDDPLNRETIRGLIASYIDDIDTANEGRDAMCYVRKKQYDVILMDVHMPYMDGFETAQAIKKEMKEKAPKIIYVTADNRDSISKQAMEQHYGSAFLSKPLRGKMLLETIDKVIVSHGVVGPYSEMNYLETE